VISYLNPDYFSYIFELWNADVALLWIECWLLLIIRDLADTVQPADVGLKEETADDDRGHGFFGANVLNRVARWAQPITYLDIHECDSFTVSFTTLVCTITVRNYLY